MAWFMDEYGKLHGHTPAICTGKPIALEGSYGREAATGRGCVYMFREAAPAPRPQPRPTPPSSSRATATSAPGPRGSCSSSAHDGRRLRRHGAIRNDDGIDANALDHIVRGGGVLTEFEGAEPIDPDDLLAVPCDVFIPAALGGMIHEGNADRMSARCWSRAPTARPPRPPTRSCTTRAST